MYDYYSVLPRVNMIGKYGHLFAVACLVGPLEIYQIIGVCRTGAVRCYYSCCMKRHKILGKTRDTINILVARDTKRATRINVKSSGIERVIRVVRKTSAHRNNSPTTVDHSVHHPRR
jgi:hypothetical protein